VTAQGATWTQRLHPLRVSYEWMSDVNPLSRPIAAAAGIVRANRIPADPANPVLQIQQMISQAVANALDQWRKVRDDACETAFEAIYGSPWLQALVGLKAGYERPHPGVSPEHRDYVAREARRLHASINEGGVVEAGIRAIGFIIGARGEIDERGFHTVRRLREVACCRVLHLADYKQRVRQQALLLALDKEAAIAALPRLLERADAADIRAVATIVETAVAASAELAPAERQRLQQILATFESAADRREPTPRRTAGAATGGTQAASVETKPARAPRSPPPIGRMKARQ
jgi:hypothetical protein